MEELKLVALILFFVVTAFIDFSSQAKTKWVRGLAALVVASLLILGRNAGF